MIYTTYFLPFGSTYVFIEGGAACTPAPHCLLGCLPMLSTSVAPSAISLWVNHGWLSSLPFRVALCMYLFSSLQPLAMMCSTFPLPIFTFISVNNGLPMLYIG